MVAVPVAGVFFFPGAVGWVAAAAAAAVVVVLLVLVVVVAVLVLMVAAAVVLVIAAAAPALVLTLVVGELGAEVVPWLLLGVVGRLPPAVLFARLPPELLLERLPLALLLEREMTAWEQVSWLRIERGVRLRCATGGRNGQRGTRWAARGVQRGEGVGREGKRKLAPLPSQRSPAQPPCAA